MTEKLDTSGCRDQQPQHQLYQCRLPGAVWSDKSDVFTGYDVAGYIAQHVDRIIPVRQVLDVDKFYRH